ncbi:hypothetical protein M0804_007828 [Polistes exclamans]|nr:hypothetical protein M0804_007828 [Polistes exclamans]
MKESFWLVAIVATILAAADLGATTQQQQQQITVPTECPANDPFDTTVFLAHESDCSKFYICFLGEKILKDCPYENNKGDRLHFNPLKQVCDYPADAGCLTPPISGEKLITPAAKQLTNKADSKLTTLVSLLTTPRNIPSSLINSSNVITLKPHECEYNLYYKYINGNVILNQCENNFHWNQERKACYKPNETECMAKGISVTPLELPYDVNCIDGEYYIHECQCDKYYFCVSGNKVLKSCEKGLYWGQRQKKCTTPAEANCPHEKPRECTEGTTKPHPCECSLYYKCINGQNVLRQCPDGLHWSQDRQICTTPEEAGCIKICDEGTYKPHENQCTQYYKCQNNRWNIQQCPNGLHWSKDRQTCTTPREAKCIKICEEGDHKPDEDKCEIYYECNDNRWIRKSCPAGFHWNRITNICTDPASAKCPNAPRVCVEGTFKPHECECDIYFECKDNQYIQRKCGNGLHWNRVSNICTSPDSAGCPNYHPKICDEGSYKPDDKLCDVYYKCENNKYVPKYCSAGFHWNRITNTCTDPASAHCPNAPRVCLEGSYKPHECRCDIYFECRDNQYIQRICSNGLHWNRITNICTNPDSAGCPNYHPKICDEGSHKPHETECDIYYECQNNAYVRLKCSSGLHWDRIHNYCTTPDNAKCPNYHPKICDEGSYKPDDTICEIYYKCENNQFVTKSCTGGLHWNRVKNICSDPNSAKCPNYHPKICDEGSYKPDDKICEIYYKCENNQFVTKSCTGGLHWDRVNNICTDPDSAKCPNYHPTVCQEGSYSPHECQCNAYYKCINNRLILQYCPSGKYWKQTANVCTDPDDSNCRPKTTKACFETLFGAKL